MTPCDLSKYYDHLRDRLVSFDYRSWLTYRYAFLLCSRLPALPSSSIRSRRIRSKTLASLFLYLCIRFSRFTLTHKYLLTHQPKPFPHHILILSALSLPLHVLLLITRAELSARVALLAFSTHQISSFPVLSYPFQSSGLINCYYPMPIRACILTLISRPTTLLISFLSAFWNYLVFLSCTNSYRNNYSDYPLNELSSNATGVNFPYLSLVNRFSTSSRQSRSIYYSYSLGSRSYGNQLRYQSDDANYYSYSHPFILSVSALPIPQKFTPYTQHLSLIFPSFQRPPRHCLCFFPTPPKNSGDPLSDESIFETNLLTVASSAHSLGLEFCLKLKGQEPLPSSIQTTLNQTLPDLPVHILEGDIWTLPFTPSIILASPFNTVPYDSAQLFPSTPCAYFNSFSFTFSNPPFPLVPVLIGKKALSDFILNQSK